MSGTANEIGGIPVVDIPPPRPAPPGFRMVVIGCLAILLTPLLLLGLALGWYFLAPQPIELPGATTEIETIAVQDAKPSIVLDTWLPPGFRAARNGKSHVFMADESEDPSRYYVQALDEEGRELWMRGVLGIDEISDARLVSLASLPDGGCYVGVAFDSTIEIFQTENEAQPVIPSEKGSILLIKIGPGGTWEWQTQFSTTGPLRLDELIAANDGSCVVLGNAPESITVPVGVAHESDTRVFDAAKPGGFLARYTPSGDLASLYRVNLDGRFCAMEIAADGSYTVHGVTNKTLTALRLNPDGTEIWRKLVLRYQAPPNMTCYDYGIDGSVVLGTQFTDSLTVDPNGTSKKVIDASDMSRYDLAIVKVDRDGNIAWTTQVGPLSGSLFEQFGPSVSSDLCVFDDGSCMVAATFSGSVVIPEENAVNGSMTYRGIREGLLAMHIGADGSITNVSRIAHGGKPSHAAIHNIGDRREFLIFGLAQGNIAFEPEHVANPDGKKLSVEADSNTRVYFWSKIEDRPIAK
jgi:hypothetical protein